MKVPREFLLKGKLWTTRYTRGMSSDGNTNQITRTIDLRWELSKEEKLETFIHEFVHASLFELHLSGPSDALPEKTEEIICTGLADIICSTFELKLKKEAKP